MKAHIDRLGNGGVFNRRRNSGRLYNILIGMVAFICLTGAPLSLAHDQTNNQVYITRNDTHCLSLKFLLRPIDTIHGVLSPEKDWLVFFAEYANLSEEAFNIRVNAIQRLLEESSVFFDDQGQRIFVKAWLITDLKLWRKSVKEERILFLSRAGNAGHSDSIEFKAEGCAKDVIGRIQVGFDSRLFPLEVIAHDTDRFWLNRDIPSATVDF